MNLGNCIKQARKMADLTQEQLAKKAGISFMSIRRYESGERTPTVEVLQEIANALNMSLTDLIDIEVSLLKALRRAGLDIDIAKKNDNIPEETRLKMLSYFESRFNSLQEMFYGEDFDADQNEVYVVIAFELNKLNEKGQQVAVERVRELAKIPEYRNEE